MASMPKRRMTSMLMEAAWLRCAKQQRAVHASVDTGLWPAVATCCDVVRRAVGSHCMYAVAACGKRVMWRTCFRRIRPPAAPTSACTRPSTKRRPELHQDSNRAPTCSWTVPRLLPDWVTFVCRDCAHICTGTALRHLPAVRPSRDSAGRGSAGVGRSPTERGRRPSSRQGEGRA